MTINSPNSARRRKALIASFVAYLMITGQLAPLVLANSVRVTTHSRLSGAKSETGPTARPKSEIVLNAAVPQPAPEPPAAFAPSIVATLDDGLAAATTVAPGGVITYTANIRNNGINSPADDALNVLFTN